jgi:hypothetical protein
VLDAAVTDLARRCLVRDLRLVLDTDAFLDTLRRIAPQADLRAAKIHYVSLRSPTRCRVGYRLDVGGTEWDLGVRAGQPGDVAWWQEDGGPTAVPGPLGPGRITLEASAVMLSVFPNDPRLPEIRHLLDAQTRRPRLTELFPTRPEFWQGELRTLRYRPERRFVAQVSGADGSRALLKGCTSRAYPRSKANAVAFESRGPLRIARLLGCSDQRHLLAFEWLPGISLLDVYSAPEVDRQRLIAAGSALAALHRQRPPGLPTWTDESEAAHISAVAAEIGFVCPELSRRATTLAQALQTRLCAHPGPRLAMHGDLSARHLLLDDGTVAIVDLDWACYGDPADDLGYLVAQVERSASRGKVEPDRVAWVRDALLEGYDPKPSPDLRRRVGLYTAIGLFQQARFPFRAWAPDWPASMEALLARAESFADALAG